MTLPFDLTIAQINPTVGDLEGNLDKIRQVRDANLNTDLILFPEMTITGYPADDLLLKPSFVNDAFEKIQILVEDSKNIKPYILVGAPLRKNGHLYNAAFIIGDGKIQHEVLKYHLPNDGVFDEKRYFTPAPTMPTPFMFKKASLGIMICEDMWHPDVAIHLKEQGAEFLIVPNASPFAINKENRRHEQARARVKDTNLPLIYVHQYGGQDDLVFDGIPS